MFPLLHRGNSKQIPLCLDGEGAALKCQANVNRCCSPPPARETSREALKLKKASETFKTKCNPQLQSNMPLRGEYGELK